jgi:hypothetical protein
MSQSGNFPDAASPNTANDRMLAQARPAWRQFLVNLKVWAPYFSNRVDRDRVVRFSAIDERVGLKWTAAMPKQCWSCGSEEPLATVEFKRTLRTYENPLAILAGTAGGAGIGLLLLVFAPGIFTFLLLVVIVAIGLMILRLKSWVEDVRLIFWSCPQHAHELEPPEMCIDDQQLCVFSPTLELAQAAREAIRAKRKRGLKPYDEAASPREDEPAPARTRRTPSLPAAPEPPSYERPQPVELPPIRLAGEEDDAPA